MIYLFSAKWSKEEVDKLNDDCKGTPVYVISPDELFDVLKDNKWIICSDFYEINE